MSINELKVVVYDLSMDMARAQAVVENIAQRIQAINQEIEKRPPEIPVPHPPVKPIVKK